MLRQLSTTPSHPITPLPNNNRFVLPRSFNAEALSPPLPPTPPSEHRKASLTPYHPLGVVTNARARYVSLSSRTTRTILLFLYAADALVSPCPFDAPTSRRTNRLSPSLSTSSTLDDWRTSIWMSHKQKCHQMGQNRNHSSLLTQISDGEIYLNYLSFRSSSSTGPTYCWQLITTKKKAG